jgi:hypothetical protein
MVLMVSSSLTGTCLVQNVSFSIAQTIGLFRGDIDFRIGDKGWVVPLDFRRKRGGSPLFLTELVAQMFVLVHFLVIRLTKTSKNHPNTPLVPIWVFFLMISSKF